MPARPPRILTLRLLAVALVAGVVLAVAGVPIAAVVSQAPALAQTPPRRTLSVYDTSDGMLYTRRAYPMHTTWHARPMPAPDVGLETRRLHAQFVGTPWVEAPGRPPGVPGTIGRDGQPATWYGVGWPMRSAFAEMRSGGSAAATRGLAQATASGRPWGVPYLPLWSGLAANTLVFAAPALGVLVLVRWWRLRRRRRRNLCAACAYDLSGSEGTCPECGLALEV